MKIHHLKPAPGAHKAKTRKRRTHHHTTSVEHARKVFNRAAASSVVKTHTILSSNLLFHYC